LRKINMALEPVSSTTTAGIAIGAGAITITGSIFGVQYDALIAGFFGGLCYLTYIPQTSKLKVASSLLTASLMAGYFTPILSAALAHYFEWLQDISSGAFHIGVAAWIGFAGQSAGPAVIKKLNTWIKG
jgi:hypothetical protein